MKRSEMRRKILKVLKTWENSKITVKTAEDVLQCIEEAGMEPPMEKILPELTWFGRMLEKCGFKFGRFQYEWEFPHESTEWDPE